MTCPFIDSNNPHCNENLNMQKLDEAYELCNDHHELCPLYLQLILAQPEPVGAAVHYGSKSTVK